MKAAVYARKSTDDGGDSTARQIEHARAYAEKKGWTVSNAHIYEDTGISGAEFENRPGLQKLLSTLKPRSPFSALIMSEESRLGREMLEVGWRLKQLSVAGVRVFLYLQDRELTINSPTEKVLLSVTNFAAEVERERARERTRDALLRKAKLGHVTGGKVFGYTNKEVCGPDGKRLHVERVINEDEAEVVRNIFQLSAAGKGFARIAKTLNERGAQAPQGKGRRRTWAPTTIREILHRELYRGEIVWNKIRKRDQWGKKKYESRPESEWVRVPAPNLRIVPEELWKSSHERLNGVRSTYLRRNNGQLWGRPTSGIESKYLLTGMTQCASCGAGLVITTQGQGAKRKSHYRCSYNYNKGKTVCANNLHTPMERTNREVLSTLERDILQPKVVEAAVRKALERLRPQDPKEHDKLTVDLAIVEAEAAHLAEAIASGGDIPALLDAVKEREKRRAYLQEELQAVEGLEKIAQLDLGKVKQDLRDRLTDWQGLLQRQPVQARQILRKLLVGRLVFTPQEDEGGRFYAFSGECSLGRVLEGVVLPKALKTPTGHQPHW